MAGQFIQWNVLLSFQAWVIHCMFSLTRVLYYLYCFLHWATLQRQPPFTKYLETACSIFLWKGICEPMWSFRDSIFLLYLLSDVQTVDISLLPCSVISKILVSRAIDKIIWGKIKMFISCLRSFRTVVDEWNNFIA